MISQAGLLDAMSEAMNNGRAAHWDGAYYAKAPESMSWFQARPEMSLRLIARTGVRSDAPIVDVGGGASSLASSLLKQGHDDLTVLDVASPALAAAREAAGGAAARISWITADITDWAPARRYGLWHDRAALHFLTDTSDQAAYARALREAIGPSGWAIIGGFAPGGPSQCSGLPVVQHDADSLIRTFGDDFRLLETHGEVHVTPQGREQRFRYHVFQRA